MQDSSTTDGDKIYTACQNVSDIFCRHDFACYRQAYIPPGQISKVCQQRLVLELFFDRQLEGVPQRYVQKICFSAVNQLLTDRQRLSQTHTKAFWRQAYSY